MNRPALQPVGCPPWQKPSHRTGHCLSVTAAVSQRHLLGCAQCREVVVRMSLTDHLTWFFSGLRVQRLRRTFDCFDPDERVLKKKRIHFLMYKMEESLIAELCGSVYDMVCLFQSSSHLMTHGLQYLGCFGTVHDALNARRGLCPINASFKMRVERHTVGRNYSFRGTFNGGLIVAIR